MLVYIVTNMEQECPCFVQEGSTKPRLILITLKSYNSRDRTLYFFWTLPHSKSCL